MPDSQEEFESLCTRAIALRKNGRASEALPIAREALALAPESVPAMRIVASALRALKQNDEATKLLQQAAEIEPENSELQFALGNALESQRRYTEAAEAFAIASRAKPNWSNPRYARGAALARIGRLIEANLVFREALAMNPADPTLHSNVLFGELYSPDATDVALMRDHASWWKAHGEKLFRVGDRHANDRSPDRVLNVGYVSPDFREHPISFFIEPIMRSHQAGAVKCCWYCDVAAPDATTNRLHALAKSRGQVWRDCHAMNDLALCDLVRADAIDILVDLSQHMSRNRMTMFARKPAPLQVCYLGYPYSTGLTTMDYRLSDPHIDQANKTTTGPEKIARLPESYFCYAPPEQSPDVAARTDAALTFGSLNQLMKINSRTIDGWARVLTVAPDSRLVMKAKGLEDPFARERFQSEFAQRGIAIDRIEFLGFSPLIEAMKEMSQRVDIVLDTFPYPGGTTSCHLLWMGLPVITIAGELPIHRMGASILNNIGLPEFVAKDAEEFVAIATKLASDEARRNGLRASLRNRMRESPLMDGERFARNLESLYRQMWQSWCR